METDKVFFKYLRTIAGFIVICGGLFISIWRILLWDVINRYIQANIYRLSNLFALSHTEVVINFTTITRYLSYFIVIAVPLLLVNNQNLRRKSFWVTIVPLIAILFISIISQYWSLVPSSTSKRALYLLAVSLAGIFMGLELKQKTIIRILEIFSGFIIIISYIMIFRYPQATIMTRFSVGAWTGLFDHKNELGNMAAFFSILFLFRLLNFRNDGWLVRLYGMLFFALSLFILIKSDSAASLISFIAIVCIVILAMAFLKWGHLLQTKGKVFISAIGIFLLGVLLIFRDSILGIFGRNSSFTGRVPLWVGLIPYIKSKILLGYGFGEAFWSGGAGQPLTDELLKTTGWDPSLSHNGYLEAILGTGLIGFVFYILFFIQTAYFSIAFFIRERLVYSLIFTAWFVQVMLINIVENKFGTLEIFFWLLLVVAFIFSLRNALESSGPSTLKTSRSDKNHP
jgi:exopolysaccharide production protein ExoQ